MVAAWGLVGATTSNGARNSSSLAATADAASQQDSGVKIAIQAEIDFVR
jgi:hypothetical protein